MRPNTLRALWAEGKTALNGWMTMPGSWPAEIMANAGWDSVTVDMQHGLADHETVMSMFQAISTTGVVPMARAEWNDPAHLMHLLDAGAYGIVCPMINSAAEAESFVRACKYPPQGFRSLGPTRAAVYGGADYAHRANETIITLAMIETRGALDNLAAILAVPGLDGVFVGPQDLGLALTGTFGLPMTDPILSDAIHAVLNGARDAGRIAAIWTPDVASAKAMVKLGFQLVSVGTDSGFLTAAVKDAVRAVRG